MAVVLANYTSYVLTDKQPLTIVADANLVRYLYDAVLAYLTLPHHPLSMWRSGLGGALHNEAFH